MQLGEQTWSAWAEVALANIDREYPHALAHLMDGPAEQLTPRGLHPAFFGSLDWHSCVEMHWVLVRLLRTRRDCIPAERVRRGLAAHLTPAALAAEAAYLARAGTWERPYGWGWALTLAEELQMLAGDEAPSWREAFTPLATTICTGTQAWLAKAEYPVRHGLHSNSAFGLARSLGYARAADPALVQAIEDAARRWFLDDTDYPAHYEPSGTDFLSPALTEAELMGLVLEPAEFVPWLDRFLPGLAAGEPAALFRPVAVTDPADGHLAHLHGLNLSRAFGFRRIGEMLPESDPRRAALATAAERHAQASLPATVGSDYMVEHWLAAYAVLLLT